MQYLSDVLSSSYATIIVISALCGVAILIVRDLFSQPPIAFVIYPFVVFISLCIAHAFYLYEFYAPTAMDHWLLFMVLSAGIGTAGCLLTYVVLSGLFGLVAAVRRSRPAARYTVRHIRLGRE